MPTGTSNLVPPDDDAGSSLSLTARAFIGTLLIVLTVIVAVLSAVAVSARRVAIETAQQSLENSAELVAQLLAARQRTLVGGARVFVQNPLFHSLVAVGRREEMLDRAIEAADQIGADWAFITDKDGVLVAKSDENTASGKPMGNFPLITGALGGQEQSGFGASGDTMLFQAVALPISAKLGAPVGVLVATQVVDSLFLHDIKVVSSSELLFYTRDDAGREHPAASTIAGSAKDLAAFLAARSSANSAIDGVTLGRARYMSMGTSLFTAGGTVVGGFLVLRARDDAATTLAALRTPLMVALLVGTLITLIVGTLVSRYLTQPVHALTNAVTRASEGDLAGVRRHALVQSGTLEVHNLETAFHALVNDLRDKEALIAASSMLSPSSGANASQLPAERFSRHSRPLSSKGISMHSVLHRQINNPGLVLEPGAVMANRYFIQAEVGRGGLGIVYRALDRVLGEVIAIKVLRPELALANAGSFEQLKSELRIAQRLSHRNIVRTHDIGETEAAPFLTMEYVDGASLATVIQARGALSRAAVLAMAKQLLGALAVAHDRGIVHGDLKPQNLLINTSGLLKVTDFGVARLVRGARPSRAIAEPRGINSESASAGRLTGAVLGSPEYMAPEQLIGELSSTKTDLYAIGVVLKECVTGTTPYQSDTPVEFVARKLGADTQLPGSGVAGPGEGQTQENMRDIVAIIENLVNPLPELRPASARETLLRFGMLA